ncbi:MAG: Gfo/Idh/MocA family oxidoreductase [Acidobacteriaceae bacterium]
MEKSKETKRTSPLVAHADDIKLAFVGKVEEDDHPYSWSAIFNGYDPGVLAECPNAVIREYLAGEPKRNFGIVGARVTHIWCDDPEDAKRVARVSRIPYVVSSPGDVIGHVDAVVIPTDRGNEHLERARPFIEEGIPVLIDKPLTLSVNHLRQFVRWHEEGKHFLSSSCMRYAKEFMAGRDKPDKLGSLRFVTATTCRSWERYGIHALEAVYPFLPTYGWKEITITGTEEAAVVHLLHDAHVDVVIAAMKDMDGSFGCVSLYGTKGALNMQCCDSFFAFKAQLASFVDYLRSGQEPYSFAETVELMKIVIAGIRSRAQGGQRIALAEIEL